MQITKRLRILTGVLLMAGTAFAQAENTTLFYHLDFVTKELDDNKVINSRNYSMIISDKSSDGGNSLRTGSRMPFPTTGANLYTYAELGVNIDCRNVKEVAGQLNLLLSADISTAASETAVSPSLPPIVRQYKWSSGVTVPLRKATLIYSSDDLGSKRKFQLELTATPVK